MDLSNMLYINAGRKGSLQDLQDYWDVATFFEVSVLWADYSGACKAARYMHKLNPPSWQLFNFWLEFFQECIQNPEEKEKPKESSKTEEESGSEKKKIEIKPEEEKTETDEPQRILFPVLLVDMSGEESRPAHLHLHAHSDKPNMRVCYIENSQHPPPKTNHRAVTPMVFTFNDETGTENGETAPKPNFFVNQTYDLVFFEDDIKGFRFLAAIRASLSDYNNYLVDEHEDDEPIRFAYELDDNGHPIVLGSGSFGTVYAGRELSREIKIAIKEIKNIPQKDLQPLIEEINLQSRLNHTNIVCYLGSVYEDGVLKILMEHVPGGSLSFLLKKIGSLRDETVSHYSSQILEGLRYLCINRNIRVGQHASKIIHRDIKGDNILLNMYRGELKIADFGASKRLGGLIRKAGTVTGKYRLVYLRTMRFMAPELINASKDGYGYPADIWSFGCTVVEMVTGKLPYHEASVLKPLDAYAAFYRAGYYSDHPDIPEELPEPCKAFIKRCFEIDPEKRASAAQLLSDPYILIQKSLPNATNNNAKFQEALVSIPAACSNEVYFVSINSYTRRRQIRELDIILKVIIFISPSFIPHMYSKIPILNTMYSTANSTSDTKEGYNLSVEHHVGRGLDIQDHLGFLPPHSKFRAISPVPIKGRDLDDNTLRP
ncbi:unnamed protein product [Hymenolepis diminuta]|uniref:Protein kinase domain-containing protein n=1 Tax=Hymenolepis diminuta TaxID=6216 RepID=A0A158QFE7_HYMDI|nr:unnamed protein product [Hymenolepis diminuta]